VLRWSADVRRNRKSLQVGTDWIVNSPSLVEVSGQVVLSDDHAPRLVIALHLFNVLREGHVSWEFYDVAGEGRVKADAFDSIGNRDIQRIQRGQDGVDDTHGPGIEGGTRPISSAIPNPARRPLRTRMWDP